MLEKRLFLLVLFILLLTLACATYDEAISTPTLLPTGTFVLIPTGTPTPTPTFTQIVFQTFTPLPTITPLPTETLLPTPTGTPIGSGSGKIVYWLAEDNQTGASNLDGAFWSVWTFDLNTGLRSVLLESDGETSSYMTSSVDSEGKTIYFTEVTFSEGSEEYTSTSLMFSYNLALGGIELLSIIPETGDGESPAEDLLYESWPDISENGLSLVFQSNREFLAAEDFSEKLYWFAPGSETIHAIEIEETFPLRARYSPDGGKVALTAWDGNDWEIYVYYVNGSARVQITDNDAADRYPEWSPDGKWLVFHSNREGNYDLYMYELPTKETTRLTLDDADDVTASFSPDGAHILFVSDRDENYDMYVYSLADREEELLLDLEASIGVPLWVP